MDTGTRRRVERRRVTVQHATMSAAFVAAQSALGGMNGAKPVEISRRGAFVRSRARDSTGRRAIRFDSAAPRVRRRPGGGRAWSAMGARGARCEAYGTRETRGMDDRKWECSVSVTCGGGETRARAWWRRGR